MKVNALLIPICMALLNACNSNNISEAPRVSQEPFSEKFIERQALATINRELQNRESKDLAITTPSLMLSSGTNSIPNLELDSYHQSIQSRLLKQWPYATPSTPIAITTTTERAYLAYSSANEIVLSFGIVADARSEDEIAFIIAHELSHILLGHHDDSNYFLQQKEIIDKSANLTLLAVVASDMRISSNSDSFFELKEKNLKAKDKTVQNVYRSAILLNDFSRDVVSSYLSRENEEEADLLAVDLLVKAGYSPTVYQTVFDRMDSSQQFSEKQVAHKRGQIEDRVGTVIGDDMPETKDEWGKLGIDAAKDLLVGIIDQSSQRHEYSDERKSRLAEYVRSQYRAERRRPVSEAPLLATIKSPTVWPTLESYWNASESMRALEYGKISSASSLAKKAVSGAASGDAFPRLAMFYVTSQKGQTKKALENLEHISNWQGASINTYVLAAEAFLSLGKADQTLELLEKGARQYGSELPFYAQYIAAYKAAGNDDAVRQTLNACDATKNEALISSCHRAAGLKDPNKDIMQEAFNSILSTVEI